jgi:hypothetical protein
MDFGVKTGPIYTRRQACRLRGRSSEEIFLLRSNVKDLPGYEHFNSS